MDYRLPLRFDEEVTIEARLHWSEAARMNIEFIIRKLDGQICTTGYSIQLMLDEKLDLLIFPPPFYNEVLRRWKAGEFS